MAAPLKFTAEEMTSDPEPKAPTVRMVECDDDEPLEEEQNRADAWFDSNKNVRVPMIALQEDIYTIPGQNFVCFSVIKPEDYGALHHKDGSYQGSLIKFRGVFATREEADTHIRKIMKSDRHFDVHLVPAFTWAGMDDDMLEDREYADNTIGELMKGYFESENNRMKGVRARIKSTQDATTPEDMRGEESTEFYNKSIEWQKKEAPVRPEGVKAQTLEELAASLDITPGGETVMTKSLNDIPESKIDAVVSEILLDEEDAKLPVSRFDKVAADEDDEMDDLMKK